MPAPDPLAARLTIQLDAAVLWHHRPAYAELVHRAHREGLAGASVFHGVTGFGAGDPRPRHPGRAPGPCVVIIVDEERRLRSFLPCVADVLCVTAAVATLDRVRIHVPGSTG
jgi:PII-like signaling protein